jgi:CRISPR-associated protein Csb1
MKLEQLQNFVRDAAALRRTSRLQPIGGKGDKIFPPTYLKDSNRGPYAIEDRLNPETGEVLPCVLLDSVASQANRAEEALLEAHDEGRVKLPIIRVNFDGGKGGKSVYVSSYEAPHRVYDALFRDSLLDGQSFPHSPVGKEIQSAEPTNASPMLKYGPNVLAFGGWDSTGPKGGLGAKFARIFSSEIVGVNVKMGVKVASRLDPAGIEKASTIYQTPEGSEMRWTTDHKAARQEKNKPVPYKKGNPSDINHGNIPPTIEDGGFTIEFAEQRSVISLAGVRRLRFPVDGRQEHTRNLAARTAVTALALLGSTLSAAKGYDLRSRCALFPEEKLQWEVLLEPGEAPQTFTLSANEAIELFNAAVGALAEHNLPWHDEEIHLQPSSELVTLIAKSQEKLILEGVSDEVES